MDKLVELTEFLVKSIVSDEESISVKSFEDEEFITIEILVNEDSMGAVIGRDGINASAIRTLVQASSYINQQKKVKININSI